MPNLKVLGLSNSKGEKQFPLPMIVLVIIILGGVFLLKPKITNIINSRREIAGNRKILADLTEKVSLLQGLSKPELTDKTDLVLKVLPAEKNVAQTMSVIKKIALNNELIVSELTIAEVGEIASGSSVPSRFSKDEILPSLTVQLTLSGAREKIVNFLTQVKATAPLMKVSGLSISQKIEGLDEAVIDIKSYYLPLPKTLNKAEQVVAPVTTQEETVFDKLNTFSLINEEEITTPSTLPSGGKLDLFSY